MSSKPLFQLLAKAVIIVLTGCDSTPATIDTSAPAVPSVAAPAPTVVASSTAAAPAPAASIATPRPPSIEEQRRAAIPTPPKDVSPRPTSEEWKTAPEVNSGDPNRRPRDCTMRMLREWLQIGCSTGDGHAWPLSPWGKGGVDWFQTGDDLELRLRPGSLLRGYLGASHRGHFLVAWPTTDDKPHAVSLETPLPNGILAPMPTPLPLPPIPTTDAERPGDADWVAAVPVNTTKTTAGKLCTLSVRGQWARLLCLAPPEQSLPSWERFAGLGTKNVDHFVASLGVVSSAEQLDFRLRRGNSVQALLAWSFGNGGRIRLEYKWPEDAAQPTELSFEESYPK